MSEQTTQCCESCRYWKPPLVTEDRVGDCHRFPPTFFPRRCRPSDPPEMTDDTPRAPEKKQPLRYGRYRRAANGQRNSSRSRIERALNPGYLLIRVGAGGGRTPQQQHKHACNFGRGKSTNDD
jgi:hypothetical protein